MRIRILTTIVLATGLVLPTAPGAALVWPPAGTQGLSAATSELQSAAKTRYYKSNWYPGYVAVRFRSSGAKVRAVFYGDGPGWCFVGRRVSQGTYRGKDHTFSGGSRRATYSRSDLVGGRRVTPPGWFRKSSARAFRFPQCQ